MLVININLCIKDYIYFCICFSSRCLGYCVISCLEHRIGLKLWRFLGLPLFAVQKELSFRWKVPRYVFVIFLLLNVVFLFTRITNCLNIKESLVYFGSLFCTYLSTFLFISK